MCRYMTNAEHLMVAIDHEKPLLGQPLNDVLAWQRPTQRRRLLLRAGQPQAQVGAGAGDDPLRAGAARDSGDAERGGRERSPHDEQVPHGSHRRHEETAATGSI